MLARRMALALTGAVSLLLAGYGLGVQLAPGTATAQGPSPEGTWALTTNWPDGRQTLGYATLHADGTYAIAISNPRATAGNGVWARGSGNDVNVTWEALVFNEEGQVRGTQRVRSRLTLDGSGESYTSRSMVEVRDRAGTVLSTDTNTSQARRMRVDPLP